MKLNKINFEDLKEFNHSIKMYAGSGAPFYETTEIDFKCYDNINNRNIYVNLRNTNALAGMVDIAIVESIYINEYHFSVNYRKLEEEYGKLLSIKAKGVTKSDDEFNKEMIDFANLVIEQCKLKEFTYGNRYYFPHESFNTNTFFFDDNRLNIYDDSENGSILKELENGDLVKQTYGDKTFYGIYDNSKNYAMTYLGSNNKERCVTFPRFYLLSEENANKMENIESIKPDFSYGNDLVKIDISELPDAEKSRLDAVMKNLGFKYD